MREHVLQVNCELQDCNLLRNRLTIVWTSRFQICGAAMSNEFELKIRVNLNVVQTFVSILLVTPVVVTLIELVLMNVLYNAWLNGPIVRLTFRTRRHDIIVYLWYKPTRKIEGCNRTGWIRAGCCSLKGFKSDFKSSSSSIVNTWSWRPEPSKSGIPLILLRRDSSIKSKRHALQNKCETLPLSENSFKGLVASHFQHILGWASFGDEPKWTGGLLVQWEQRGGTGSIVGELGGVTRRRDRARYGEGLTWLISQVQMGATGVFTGWPPGHVARHCELILQVLITSPILSSDDLYEKLLSGHKHPFWRSSVRSVLVSFSLYSALLHSFSLALNLIH